MGRRFSKRIQDALLEELETSDEPIAQVARRHGVAANTAYKWLHHARAKRDSTAATSTVKFARVVPKSQAGQIAVCVGDARIEVAGEFDPELLRRVVAALSSSS